MTKPQVECPDCGGSGIDDMDDSMYCPLCDGKKVVDAETAEVVLGEWAEYGKATGRENDA